MTTLTRREFLKTSGALVVSFAAPPLTEAAAQITAGKPPLVPTELDSWVAVLPDGRVQAFFGKMDMGQSLEVAIAQIVADELDVACDKVDVLMGDTGTSCNQGGASGSTGVSNGGRLLRNAAAEARRLLLGEAARLAARCRTDEQAAELEELAGALVQAPDDGSALLADWAFMSALVGAAGNLVFQLIMNSVRELYLPPSSAFAALVADRAELAPMYLAVAEAVGARDADRAVGQMDRLAGAQEARMVKGL